MGKLPESDILAGATVCMNQENLSEEVKHDAKFHKNEYVWHSNRVISFQWWDNKNVRVLSNFHDPGESTEVSRNLTNGSALGVACLKSVSDYNKWMGSADRFDRRRNTRRFTVRGGASFRFFISRWMPLQ